MKTTRDQLKALVKEILVEVLSEGLGRMPAKATQSHLPIGNHVVEQRRPTNRQAFDPRLDTPMSSIVKTVAGGNPIMADILADTAATTLQEQAAAERMPGIPGSASREQVGGDLSEVFGSGAVGREDGSSHWADLAFMPVSKKTA